MKEKKGRVKRMCNSCIQNWDDLETALRVSFVTVWDDKVCNPRLGHALHSTVRLRGARLEVYTGNRPVTASQLNGTEHDSAWLAVAHLEGETLRLVADWTQGLPDATRQRARFFQTVAGLLGATVPRRARQAGSLRSSIHVRAATLCSAGCNRLLTRPDSLLAGTGATCGARLHKFAQQHASGMSLMDRVISGELTPEQARKLRAAQ